MEAGGRGFKHRQQHHTLQQLRCAFVVFGLVPEFTLVLLWEVPTPRRMVFTKLAVPVCYSAQLMGNPGYIFF